MQNAADVRQPADRRAQAKHAHDPTPGEMLGEIIDLSAGLGILLLPLLLTAIPGVLLFVILPAALLIAVAAAPVAIAGAVITPPYLLVRSIRRHRAKRHGPRPSLSVHAARRRASC